MKVHDLFPTPATLPSHCVTKYNDLEMMTGDPKPCLRVDGAVDIPTAWISTNDIGDNGTPLHLRRADGGT